MIIKAGTWLGNRTKVFDARGAKLPYVKQVDLSNREATIYSTNGKGKPYALGGIICTEVVDATGWTLKLFDLFSWKL